MLNRLPNTEAKIKYTEADFQIIVPGDHVRCSVSNKQIPIEELKYWNYQKQKPYFSAKEAMQDKLKNQNNNVND